MIDQKTARKFNRALSFLDFHSALAPFVIETTELLSFSLQEVCKRGYNPYSRKKISVYYTPKNYKRFKKLFDKERAEIKEPENASEKTKELIAIEKELVRIDVPYKDYFGEPWVFDHVEYWAELPFVVFTGSNPSNYQDPREWDRYSGIKFEARSFEELIIKGAQKFKRIFGNWSSEDFLTPKEIKNHKTHDPFISKDDEESQGHFKRSIHNPKYIEVTPAQLNLRWLKWFSKTDYCKKHWISIHTLKV